MSETRTLVVELLVQPPTVAPDQRQVTVRVLTGERWLLSQARVPLSQAAPTANFLFALALETQP